MNGEEVKGDAGRKPEYRVSRPDTGDSGAFSEVLPCGGGAALRCGQGTRSCGHSPLNIIHSNGL